MFNKRLYFEPRVLFMEPITLSMNPALGTDKGLLNML